MLTLILSLALSCSSFIPLIFPLHVSANYTSVLLIFSLFLLLRLLLFLSVFLFISSFLSQIPLFLLLSFYNSVCFLLCSVVMVLVMVMGELCQTFRHLSP